MTELRGVLQRPNDSASLAPGVLRARVLASDGPRAEALLQGDVAWRTDSVQLANITRVTPSYLPRTSGRVPWRLNAYGRMPVATFCRAASLATYLDLHDVTGARDSAPPGSDPAVAGIVVATRTPLKRVEGSEVRSGDRIDVTLDDARLGGPGAAWLIGELIARAISERADFLRFSRTRLLDRTGRVRADYGIRAGNRLPPPFG